MIRRTMLQIHRHARRLVAAGMVSLMLLVSVGCYGHFPLTRAVYRVNGNIGGTVGNDRSQSKFIQSIVMWIFVIIPVYSVATFVDAFVMNLIEFWTGNVVQVGSVERDGYTYAFVPSGDGREAVMTISHEGETLARTHFTRVSDQMMEVRDGEGQMLGQLLRTAGSDLHWLGHQGQGLDPMLAAGLGL